MTDLVKRGFELVRMMIRRDQRFGYSILNISKSLNFYWPNTSGSYRQLSEIALEDAILTIPSLSQLVDLNENRLKTLQIPETRDKEVLQLEKLFNLYGSDKSFGHDYHKVYGQLLERKKVKKVLEIGIGSVDSSIPSNIRGGGKPRASLRAFRDFYPEASVFGLDIDPKLVFEEERIQTLFVNQRDFKSMSNAAEIIGRDFDLMIDDGLHSLVSSLNSLNLFLRLIRIGGYAVVEDIPNHVTDIYRLVSALIFPKYLSKLVSSHGGYLFVVQKIY